MSPEQKQELTAKINEMLAAGFYKTEIAATLGITLSKIDRLINPERYEAQLARARAQKRARTAAIKAGEAIELSEVILKRKAEFAELVAKIPKKDTRSKIGVLAGDPLYERSALYQKRTEADQEPARRVS